MPRQASTQLALGIMFEKSRMHEVADVSRWLNRRGLPGYWRPRTYFSGSYCRWLARSESQRQRDSYDALARQGWKCWQCGAVAGMRVDLHHSRGYGDMTDGLVAVHRGKCHRKAHEEMGRELRRTAEREACGCRVA